MRRKVAREILRSTSSQFAPEPRLITFGSDRKESDRCTLYDQPARFDQCLGCAYRRGSQGLGILCGHRFGIDPTYISGVLTQLQDGDILPLEPPP
jgi:hypothetical protein